MENFINAIYLKFNKTKAAIGLIGIAVYLILIELSGGSMVTMAIFCAEIIVGILIPGVMITKLLKADKISSTATVPLSIFYGTGFFAASYCVFTRFGLQKHLDLFVVLVSLLYIILYGRKFERKIKETFAKKDRNYSLFMLFGISVMLFGFCISVKNANPIVVGEIIPNPDLLWNIGNANSFKIAFPPQDIRFSEVRLSYHYLTEMVAGALSIVSGISSYDIFAFYYGPVVLLGLISSLYFLGLSFYKQDENAVKKAASLPILFIMFNCASLISALYKGYGIFSNNNLVHLITNINSQATAIIFSSIFLIIFINISKKNFDMNIVDLISILLSMVMLSFAKGPVAAIIACAFFGAMVFAFMRKPKYFKAGFCTVAVLVTFGFIFFKVFASGASASMSLGNKTLEASIFNWPLNRIREVSDYLWYISLPIAAALNFFGTIPLQCYLWVRAGLRDIRNIKTLPLWKLLAHAAVIGGVIAYNIFWHPSNSQSYFLYIAIFFANIIAVDELFNQSKKTQKTILIILASVGFATTIIMMINFVGSGTRQLLRNYDIIEKYPYSTVVTAGDAMATEWLGENMELDEKFATNRIHKADDSRDGISNIYTAISGRQAYMEGYTYAVTNMGVSAEIVDNRIQTNTKIFSSWASEDDVLEICKANNISYILYSSQFEGDVEQLKGLKVAYQNKSAIIYKAEKQ